MDPKQHMTDQEEISFWKNRCVHAEKESKGLNIILDRMTAKILGLEAEVNMWKQKALIAEQENRNKNL